jgi:excinuclease ABC subunit B
MKKAIDLTYYRRGIQKQHNEKNNMTPTTVYSSIKDIGIEKKKTDYSNIDKKDIKKEIARLELEMDIAAANMEYEKAAELRDAIIAIKA